MVIKVKGVYFLPGFSKGGLFYSGVRVPGFRNIIHPWGVVFLELQGVEVSKRGHSAILGGHFFQFVRNGWVESKNGCPQS